MTNPDNCLRRLLASAAAAPREMPDGPPPGFAARVLTHLHTVAPAEENAAFFDMLFRRALGCGFAIMLLTLAGSYRTLSRVESTEMQVANSAIEMRLP